LLPGVVVSPARHPAPAANERNGIKSVTTCD
jgi:hypothetical protein